jgi:hypothetical protein
MSFYINDFKEHLQTLASKVERKDYTEPKRQTSLTLEEQYSQMSGGPMAFPKKKKKREGEAGMPTLGKDAGVDGNGMPESFNEMPKEQFFAMMQEKGISREKIEELMAKAAEIEKRKQGQP